MMRKKVVAGNWKMNLSPTEGAAFAKELAPKLNTGKAEVVFCVPFTDISAVTEAVQGYKIGVGAQNMHFEASGAFTGEISADMLKGLGVQYVILGHSERRQYFAETDETVNKKLTVAISSGFTPIVCVGESLAQREQGITEEWVRMQTRIAFQGVKADAARHVIIAYEPIWAIGTGKTATNEQAQEACSVIRKLMSELYGEDTSSEIRVLYGGSVNAKNAADLFVMPDIDGGLVGGASLKQEFTDIVNCIN